MVFGPKRVFLWKSRVETGHWMKLILTIEAFYKYLRFYNIMTFSLIFEFSRIIELLFGWKPKRKKEKKKREIFWLGDSKELIMGLPWWFWVCIQRNLFVGAYWNSKELIMGLHWWFSSLVYWIVTGNFWLKQKGSSPSSTRINPFGTETTRLDPLKYKDRVFGF